MTNVLDPFLAEVMDLPGGDRVTQCIQCGTCSGSCPVIEEMQYGPRQIMYMIQAGQKEKLLSSHDMWYCVSCYSCTNRCPREIKITDLMASLRSMALQQGYAHDKEAQFGQSFAESVRTNGRMFEPELMIRYYLRSLDLISLLGMIPLGLKMIFKNKLPFWPDRIENPKVLQRICNPAEGEVKEGAK